MFKIASEGDLPTPNEKSAPRIAKRFHGVRFLKLLSL
jgi:hypothetical protein